MLLGALLLTLMVPAAVRAGDCPASLPSGVIEEERYRVGQTIEFFGSYLDFADPGTVSITFERTTDGAARTFHAFNSPDGAWYLFLELDPELIGRWDVSVVVEQTGATDTCTDTVEVVAAVRPPNTDTAPLTDQPRSVVPAVALALVFALAIATTLVVVFGGRGHRNFRR